MIDARVLVAAALVASPAAWRASQGLLSVSEAMTRYLLVAAGCVLLSMLVRSLWPLLSGEAASTTPEAALREAAAAGLLADGSGAEGGLALDTTTELGSLDDAFGAEDLGAFGGFSAFDDLGGAEPESALS